MNLTRHTAGSWRVGQIAAVSSSLLALPLALVTTITFVATTPASAATTGSWTYTGSMVVACAGPTATLLPDGQVLVTCPSTVTDELYNPATGTWQATGSMTVARDGSTATLLSDGEVLAAGGTGSGGVLASAELYNPSTGTWQATGTMITPRANFTATLLPDGDVLAAGGETTGGAATSNAELYIPSTGTWQATGSMNTATMEQSATILGNGSVLVVGGFTNGTAAPLYAAEIYSPATQQWVYSTSSTLENFGAGSTLTALPNGDALLAGGDTLDSDLYNPVSGTWQPAATMAYGLAFSTAVVLGDGTVLETGGGNGDSVSDTEIYNPTANTWTIATNMNQARQGQSATLLPNGDVLVAGGQFIAPVPANTVYALASAEVYNPTGTPPSAPAVTSVTPNTGPGTGGTVVTINGTNLTGVSVFFGLTAATGVTCTATACTATSPAGTGTVNVTVYTTASGPSASSSADQFTYVAPASTPTITSISPTSGTTAGGTSVTIVGTNLVGATAVKFGSTGATVTADTATSITATAPTGSAGAVTISVATAGGTVADAAAYTYVAPAPAAPTIASISPTSGSTAGGTQVTIVGTNLTSASAVDFGSSAAASFTINSATSITATTPVGSAGVVNVSVATAGGTATDSAAFTFVGAGSSSSLIPNPGFETAGVPADNWGSTLARSQSVVHSGSWSLAQTATSTSGGWDLDSNVAWCAPITSSKTYTASIWVRATATVQVDLNVDLLTSKGNYVNSVNGPTVTLAANTWTQLTLTGIKVTSSEVLAGMEPNFAKDSKGTIIYWDDMSLTSP